MTTNARTDPETGLRFYTWEGRDLPSVTSIRRLIGMPFTLHQWALSQVIERVLVDYSTIGSMLTRPKKPRERKTPENILKEVRAYLRSAATEERDVAGDRGTRIHDAIANGLALPSVDPDIVGHVAQWYDFLQATRATVLWQERQVWNLSHGYAGTGDALLQLDRHPSTGLPDGRTAMVDLKSTKGVYLDHAVQVMAYAMGEFVGENDVIDTQATSQLHAASALGILHLSETEWEWIEVEPRTDLFAGFVASLVFAQFLHDNDNSIDPLVSARIKGGTLVPVLARALGQVAQPEEAQV